MTEGLDFGSLNDVLRQSSAARNLASWDPKAVKAQHLGETLNLLDSAGPISDAYIVGSDPVAVIEGPQGSGKTVASVKKALYSAQRMLPTARDAQGRPLRRYVLSIWREKFEDLWNATIPSWWTIFPKDMPGSEWVGARPRRATHVINFEDGWGPVQLTAAFMAFGDVANPEDLRGLQFTDAYLNEIDTMPEDLFTYLVGRVGRDPPPEVMKRNGRLFGDENAPDVMKWTYRDFHDVKKDGYRLYRQPGGLSPQAENKRAIGVGYYQNQMRINAHKKWWIKRMVHNIPGMTRGLNLVQEKYDDDTMVSETPLEVFRELPVLVGIDGGFTPAATYCQEAPDGQGRTLAEIALERGGMEELGAAMLAVEAQPRFRGCEFVDRCDPSMTAGEDNASGAALEKGSDRQRLSKVIGREVVAASTNVPSRRHAAVGDKIGLNLGPGRPGYILDPSCRILRRAKQQTYHFLHTKGTNDLARVAKTFDSHVSEAEEYAYLEMGSDVARKRKSDVQRAREAKRQESRHAGRYNPFARAGR